MFKSLKIENFKSFKSFEIDGFKKINLIVGKNNVGKTNFLEALFLNSGAGNATLPLKLLGFRNQDMTGSELEWFFSKYSTLTHLNIETTFERDNIKSIRKLKVSPILNQNMDVSDLENTSENLKKIDQIFGLELKFTTPKESWTGKLELKKQAANEVRWFFDTPNEFRNELFNGYFFSPFKHSDWQEEFKKLSINKQTNRVLDVVKKVDKRIQDIQLIDKEVFVDMGFEKRISLKLLGHGFGKIFEIITFIQSNPNGMLLIDEIETGLHPGAQSILWEAIITIAQDLNIQIFATTQSEEAISLFVKAMKAANYDQAMLFSLKQLEDKTLCSKFDFEMINAAVDNDWDLR